MSKKFFPRSNSSTSSKASTSSFFRRRRRPAAKSSNNNDNNQDSNAIVEPPPLHRRSISPSDLHYFSTATGGCNAPLIPLEYHYESNQTLLDLFHAALPMNHENGGSDGVYSGVVAINDYGVAYGIGKKYIETALFTIPSHAYYGEDCQDERRRSVMEARRVIALLENMLLEDNNTNADDQEERSVALNEKRDTIQQLSIVARRSYEQVMMGDTATINAATAEEWKENVESTCTSWREYVLDSSTHLCSLLEALDCGGGLKSVVEEKEEEEDKSTIGSTGNGTGTVDDLNVKKETAIETDNKTNTYSQDLALQKASSTTSEKSRNNKECLSQIGNKPSTLSASRDAPLSVSHDNETLQNSFSMQPQISELDVVQSSESVTTESPEKEGTANESTILIDQQSTAMNNSEFVMQHSLTSDGFDRDELALVLSLSKHDCAMSSSTQHEIKDNRSLSMSEQTNYYQQYFHSLVEKDVFHIRFLDTYQGRIRGSNNGCTVIAPLTCIQYFTATQDNESSYGLHDAHINEVIDVHAPTVLSNVRTRLHLPPDSFIIPSDVHDHLLEVGLLSSSSFVGVCGGNILNDEHLMQLQQSLLLTDDENENNRLNATYNGPKRKVASPMFFHGHVVALHVIREGEKVWIELIDSLPNPEAWIKTKSYDLRQTRDLTSDSNDAPSSDERREPDDEWERHDQLLNNKEGELPLNAVRVLCTDVTHFGSLLKHYALSAFSYEEKKFIDDNQWEDNNSYFDPRVFQAFIWSEEE